MITLIAFVVVFGTASLLVSAYQGVRKLLTTEAQREPAVARSA
jgi:hypothetical protein